MWEFEKSSTFVPKRSKSTMKENVKEQLVKVAQEIFKKYGFKKSTMDEIAHAAHKGKSSLYYYFNSKEEVFRAVVELEASALRSQIFDAINRVNDPKDKLRQYIVARMRGFRNMSNFYVAIKDDFLSNLEFIEVIRKKYDDEEIEIVSTILENGIKKNVFKELDVALTARALTVIMKGLEIPLFITKEINDVETNVDDVLEILFTGINS